ncbi:hypothetical protein ACFSCW_04245 [Sphingomonas tabacisoli]|uniref:Uncharacterized protein n=1 Tax=Sphingomonas tabacisoli TaxID=2249466 RepID=A0ABW4HZB6_9SPHN
MVRTFSMIPEGTGTRIEIRYYGIQVPGPWKRCVGLKPPKQGP